MNMTKVVEYHTPDGRTTLAPVDAAVQTKGPDKWIWMRTTDGDITRAYQR
jgi:hypothetical protein